MDEAGAWYFYRSSPDVASGDYRLDVTVDLIDPFEFPTHLIEFQYAYAYDAEGNRTARFVDNDESGDLSAKASPEFAFFGPAGFTGLELPESKEILVTPPSGVAETPHRYRRPVSYSRIDKAILVFMFPPGESIDLLAAGPSQGSPGGQRGFVWHIADSEKDNSHTELDLDAVAL